jgi:hypothetical protein
MKGIDFYSGPQGNQCIDYQVTETFGVSTEELDFHKQRWLIITAEGMFCTEGEENYITMIDAIIRRREEEERYSDRHWGKQRRRAARILRRKERKEDARWLAEHFPYPY